MIVNFFKRNLYSILFVAFMLLNYRLLNIWFPLAWDSNFILFVWLSAHVVAYFGYVKPAEIRDLGKKGQSDGDKTE